MTRCLATVHGFIRPLRDFLHTEAAGGVVLVAATVVALIWANSPWKASYVDLWTTHLDVSIGSRSLDLTLREWINDGLMAIFFFVVGLEIKRELVEGELREPRRAALPAIAARRRDAGAGARSTSRSTPAATASTAGASRWPPTSRSRVGVLSLLGRRVAPSLKLFLLALAIVDDIGAIVVIAVFYSDDIHCDAAAGRDRDGRRRDRVAAARRLVAPVVRRARDRRCGCSLHESGIHATIAGVVLGLMAPTRPIRQREMVDADKLADISTVETARETVRSPRESVSVVEWLEHMLHPWTSFVIVPLFALANAGVRRSTPTSSATRVDVARHVGRRHRPRRRQARRHLRVRVARAVRLRIGTLPEGVGWANIIGVAALAGVGFTVSIFIAGLAFDGPVLAEQAKIGILIASIVAGLLGTLLLARSDASRS